MTERQIEGSQSQEPPRSQHEERWRRAAELPPEVFAALHKANRAINPIAIVATVAPDGSPHTAPSGSCGRSHPNYEIEDM
jgi:hypothetical protein